MPIRDYLSALPDPRRVPPVARFSDALAGQADEFARLGSLATGTPLKHHLEDVAYTGLALARLREEHRPPASCVYRARGRVLLGLPGNEPIVMASLPLCAALLAGNDVLVRPSNRTREVVERLVELLYRCGVSRDTLTLLPRDKTQLPESMRRADHIVWLGSSTTCREIAVAAAALPVTFTVEAEGFDIAVFDETLPQQRLAVAAAQVVEGASRHDGQTCQGIRAVLAHAAQGPAVRDALETAIAGLRVGRADDAASDATVRPRVVPAVRLEYPEQAPFESVVRLVTYTSDEELEQTLAASPFGLSLSFFTARTVEAILCGPARHARVGRVLVNAPPHWVEPGLPWGGFRRSGSAGPHDLLLEFADLVVIRHGD